jgi:uncharacterized protein YjiS (DUF1127 family)
VFREVSAAAAFAALTAGISIICPRIGARLRLTAPARTGLVAEASALLNRTLQWPWRVLQAQRELSVLAAMNEHELVDIGLTKGDVSAATALPTGMRPTDFLAQRAEERHWAGCGSTQTPDRHSQAALGSARFAEP